LGTYRTSIFIARLSVRIFQTPLGLGSVRSCFVVGASVECRTLSVQSSVRLPTLIARFFLRECLSVYDQASSALWSKREGHWFSARRIHGLHSAKTLAFADYERIATRIGHQKSTAENHLCCGRVLQGAPVVHKIESRLCSRLSVWTFHQFAWTSSHVAFNSPNVHP